MKEEENLENREFNRYSDQELIEFKEIILEKIEKAQGDLMLLNESYSYKNSNECLDTAPIFKVLEEGYHVMSKELNSKLAGRLEKFIQNLEGALGRIENKTYGICEVTGKLISKERLRSVPHTKHSMKAKLE